MALQSLIAQTHNRLGQYGEATAAFKELLEVHGVTGVELTANLSASFTSGGTAAEGLEFLFGGVGRSARVPDDAYELAFNAGCAGVELGDWEWAQERLQAAERACRSRFKAEGASDAEIEDELAAILAQLAYCAAELGRETEALDMYSKVVKSNPSDATVTAVSSNNMIALRRDTDLFDSLKRSKMATAGPVEAKLTVRQRQIMAFNRALLLVNMNRKGAELDEQVERLGAQCSASSDLPTLVLVTQLFRDKDYEAAKRELRGFIQRNPGPASVRAELTLAQILYMGGDPAASARALEGVASVAHQPATVATLVSLYEQAKDLPSALRVLDAALKANEGATGKDAKATRVETMKRAAELLMRHDRHQEAADRFQAILKIDKANPEALAYFVISTARVDPAAAEKTTKSLLDPPTQGLDVDALERAPKLAKREDTRKRAAPSQSVASDSAGPRNPLASTLKPKRKRKRKTRYPKGFDPANPNNPPYDPSRWIPRKDRKRAKGQAAKKQTKGAQGLAPADMAKSDLDRSFTPAPTGKVVPQALIGKGKRK